MSIIPGRPAALWRRADLALLIGTAAVGLALIGVGYWGVSGTRVVSEQASWAWVAALGVVIGAAGVARSVATGHRTLHRRRVSLLADAPFPAPPGTRPAGAPAGNSSVAAAAMTRYHRPDCAFVAGKVVTRAKAAEHEQAGRRPCGVCRP